LTLSVNALFFDFDNTLVDYVRSDIFALTQVADSLPVQVNTQQFIDRAVGHIMTFHDLYDRGKVLAQEMHHFRLSRTLQDFGLGWAPKYQNIYLVLNNTYVYPGAAEMLSILHPVVITGLISNSYLIDEQKFRIQKSGLAQFFDDVLVCAEIHCYKPDPGAFLHLVNKHGLEPNQCIYVGDSEKHDIQGANHAGLHSIRVIHGDTSMVKTDADYLCSGIGGLSKLLTELLEIT